LRRMDPGKKIEVDIACRMLVSGMKEAAEEFGPDKVGVFVSPDLTNEELYLAAKIAREGLGTNNISSLSILAGEEETGVLDEAFGFTGSTSDRQCVKNADLVICNNTSLESDHLIISSDIIKTLKNGAKFIVSNSTLNATDQLISTLAIDPMRGRAALLWLGVIKALQDKGLFEFDMIKDLSDLDGFAEGEDFDFEKMSELTGVERDTVFKAADLIISSKKIVIIHCPDRPQDRARDDMATLADLVLLLRRVGVKADLLLPRGNANSSGIELMGADPSFEPGRTAVKNKAAGASNRGQLRTMLEEGEIKAAFIIGEDPVAWKKTEAWFRNVEFIAAMDWTPTETTSSADVVLPGSTFLETSGTRCNFEGKLIEYKRTVEPPAGVSGREILFDLARSFGVNLKENVSGEINGIIEKNLDGALVPFCWNTGQSRLSLPRNRLIRVQAGVALGSIPPPLTQHEKYKREIINVGSGHYRVR